MLEIVLIMTDVIQKLAKQKKNTVTTVAMEIQSGSE